MTYLTCCGLGALFGFGGVEGVMDAVLAIAVEIGCRVPVRGLKTESRTLRKGWVKSSVFPAICSLSLVERL
jgi:hypothetical protein